MGYYWMGLSKRNNFCREKLLYIGVGNVNRLKLIPAITNKEKRVEKRKSQKERRKYEKRHRNRRGKKKKK